MGRSVQKAGRLAKRIRPEECRRIEDPVPFRRRVGRGGVVGPGRGDFPTEDTSGGPTMGSTEPRFVAWRWTYVTCSTAGSLTSSRVMVSAVWLLRPTHTAGVVVPWSRWWASIGASAALLISQTCNSFAIGSRSPQAALPSVSVLPARSLEAL